MEKWKSNLLEKAKKVKGNKLSEREKLITNKVIAILESGGTPSWKLHKKFTAIRVRLISNSGSKDLSKRSPNYIIKI